MNRLGSCRILISTRKRYAANNGDDRHDPRDHA